MTSPPNGSSESSSRDGSILDPSSFTRTQRKEYVAIVARALGFRREEPYPVWPPLSRKVAKGYR